MAHKKSINLSRRELSVAEKLQLERYAPWFNIEFSQDNSGCYLMRVLDDEDTRQAHLALAIAHRRLLAELCSKTVQWVFYHPGEHVADSLLSQGDSRIRRIADLYGRRPNP